MGSISEEVLGDKQNYPRGCPSKLSCYDKYPIIQQISSWRLDNAVQVTQFIDATISSPVAPQPIRNVLKESGFYSATKKKFCMQRRPTGRGGQSLHIIMNTGQ